MNCQSLAGTAHVFLEPSYASVTKRVLGTRPITNWNQEFLLPLSLSCVSPRMPRAGGDDAGISNMMILTYLFNFVCFPSMLRKPQQRPRLTRWPFCCL